MYRGKGLIELNIPSGFKNGNSVYNFEVVALEKYHSSLSRGISEFFSKQVHGWTHNIEWVDKLSKARLKSEGRIILADMESLLNDRSNSLRKNDSLIVLNIADKELESLSQLNIPPDQIFFYDTKEPANLLTQVISGLLVKRFDKQLSSAIALEDYKLAS